MRHALVALALIAAPAAAMAEGISYNYADARYFSTDSDALSINHQGVTFAGSYALTDQFFVAGDASYAKSERFSSGGASGKLDTITAALRGGVHHALTDTLDAVASGGALFADVSGNGGLNSQSDDDFGYIAQAGLRLALVPQVEIGAFYTYQSIFNSDTSAFSADLQYHVTETISVVGSASSGRNVDTYTVGARYRF